MRKKRSLDGMAFIGAGIQPEVRTESGPEKTE